MDASQFLLFIAAGLLLNLTPGPDVLYIVTHSPRLGARMLWSKAPQATADLAAVTAAELRSLKAVFMGGFWTNVLNPKVAIFFLAFVPQFIAPDTDNKALAFVLLGVLFNLNAIPVNSGWALAAACMARRSAVRRGLHWLDCAAGAIFIAFGLKLALSERPGA